MNVLQVQDLVRDATTEYARTSTPDMRKAFLKHLDQYQRAPFEVRAFHLIHIIALANLLLQTASFEDTHYFLRAAYAMQQTNELLSKEFWDGGDAYMP